MFFLNLDYLVNLKAKVQSIISVTLYIHSVGSLTCSTRILQNTGKMTFTLLYIYTYIHTYVTRYVGVGWVYNMKAGSSAGPQ